MTLVAGLPTSTLTTSRLDGSKSAVPASSGGACSASSTRRQRADRIVGEMRIGDVALLADRASAGRSASRAGRS